MHLLREESKLFDPVAAFMYARAMNKQQAKDITATLAEMAEFETTGTTDDVPVTEDDYYDFLEDCGFEENAYVGSRALGPDGTGMEDGQQPARQMHDAWTEWQAKKTAPDYGPEVCIGNLIRSRGIKNFSFS